MAKLVKCPICGKNFMTALPNKKYCSFTCKEAGNKVQYMKWKDEHPDYAKNYMKEQRKAKGKQ